MSTDFHWLLFLLGLLWFVRALLLCRAFAEAPPLDSTLPSAVPRVAVLVAADARCDAAGLRAAWREQQGVAVELGIGRTDADELPAGAMPVARALADAAAGIDVDTEWLLVCPAPVLPLAGDALARAVHHATSRGVATLSLMPRDAGTFGAWRRLGLWTDAVSELARANRGDERLPPSPSLPLPRLVRRAVWERALRDREAWDAEPQHDALLDQALGDAASHHAAAAFAGDALRWQDDRAARAVIDDAALRVLDLCDYRLGFALPTILVVELAWWYCAALGVLGTNFWGLFALGGIAAFAVPAWYTASHVGPAQSAALAAPLLHAGNSLSALRQFLTATWTGQLRLRGRPRALGALRAALARRAAA